MEVRLQKLPRSGFVQHRIHATSLSLLGPAEAISSVIKEDVSVARKLIQPDNLALAKSVGPGFALSQ